MNVQTTAHRHGTSTFYNPSTIVRANLTGRNAIRQMADDMRAAGGDVTIDDLELKGWSRAQCDQHGAEARRLAIAASADRKC